MSIQLTAISKVRIIRTESRFCIVCNACEEHAPWVFFVDETSSRVLDGVDPNDFPEAVALAADCCPVEVIKVDYDAGPGGAYNP